MRSCLYCNISLCEHVLNVLVVVIVAILLQATLAVAKTLQNVVRASMGSAVLDGLATKHGFTQMQ